MTFKPKIWYPVALILALVNVAGIWLAAAAAEPPHATLHGVLGVAFALWAQRLRTRRQAEAAELAPGTEALALDVDDLREQLAETQERLDFAERMIAQGTPQRRNDHEG
jgi:hypothetical protein